MRLGANLKFWYYFSKLSFQRNKFTIRKDHQIITGLGPNIQCLGLLFCMFFVFYLFFCNLFFCSTLFFHLLFVVLYLFCNYIWVILPTFLVSKFQSFFGFCITHAKASILSEHGPLQFQWHLHRNNFINVPVHRCSSLWYPLVAIAWHWCQVVPAA